MAVVLGGNQLPKIAIINRSTVISDIGLQQIVAALQIQVTRDYAPIWGGSANLVFVPKAAKAPLDAWWLTALDTSDQAGALGYHDLTATGLPLGKAFVKSDLDAGYSPSVTISHELLEILLDPDINLCAQAGNRLYAYEACDPCEADRFGYKINSILLSDFVTPAWFSPAPRVTRPFDFMNKITKPLGLLGGGYAQYLDLTGNSGWQQVSADKATAAARPKPGSRRERRRVDRANWQESTAKG